MGCLVLGWQKAVVWTRQLLTKVKDGPRQVNPDGHQHPVFQKFWRQRVPAQKTFLSILTIKTQTNKNYFCCACFKFCDILYRKNKKQGKSHMTIYDLSVKNPDGTTTQMSKYQGKVLLIVNTATECGFTPQYAPLTQIYKKYHDAGFEILDFPCNQFGHQAPGSDTEIASFCTMNFGADFPRFAKIDVNGPNADSLFTFLKNAAPFKGFDKSQPMAAAMDKMLRATDADYDKNPDIKWNFTKFLINKSGKVVRRFEPTDDIKSVEASVAELLKK